MLVGPAAFFGAIWMAIRSFVPALGIGKYLRIASYVIVLGVGTFGGVRFMNYWHRDLLTPKEAKLQCNTIMLLAAHNARESALRRMSLALKMRADQVASDESRIKKEERLLKEARDATEKDDGTTVCVRDDQWLRQWQRRK